MYQDILRTMAGVEVFPLLSLVLFVTVFAVVVVWAGRLDGPRLSRYSRLPLDDSRADNTGAATGDMARQRVKS